MTFSNPRARRWRRCRSCDRLRHDCAGSASSFAGAPCVRPPPQHCPDKDCSGEMVTNQGSVIEPKSGRTYFLDYPCDLKPGEDVTVVLSLHGGGSYGNWQRHYFPILDQVDKQRLIIATPNTRGWSQADDPYLHAIVTNIVDTVGKENVKSFWLAGHSMGGYNSRRIVCDSYFRDKADGLLTLSGGRLGNPPDMPASAPTFSIPPTNGSNPAARAGGPPGAADLAALVLLARADLPARAERARSADRRRGKRAERLRLLLHLNQRRARAFKPGARRNIELGGQVWLPAEQAGGAGRRYQGRLHL